MAARFQYIGGAAGESCCKTWQGILAWISTCFHPALAWPDNHDHFSSLRLESKQFILSPTAPWFAILRFVFCARLQLNLIQGEAGASSSASWPIVECSPSVLPRSLDHDCYLYHSLRMVQCPIRIASLAGKVAVVSQPT